MATQIDIPDSILARPVLVIEDDLGVVKALHPSLRELFPQSLIQVSTNIQEFEKLRSSTLRYGALILDPGISPSINSIDQRIEIAQKASDLLLPNADVAILTGMGHDPKDKEAFYENGYKNYFSKGLYELADLFNVFEFFSRKVAVQEIFLEDALQHSKLTFLNSVQNDVFKICQNNTHSVSNQLLASHINITTQEYNTNIHRLKLIFKNNNKALKEYHLLKSTSGQRDD